MEGMGILTDGNGISFNVAPMQIGGEMSQQEASPDEEGNHAIKILALGLPEIALVGSGTLWSAKCLPAPFRAAYAAIFLLLFLLDAVLLIAMAAAGGSCRALSKFGKVAALAIVMLVPFIALLFKVVSSIYAS